jgi:hypothetical protein
MTPGCQEETWSKDPRDAETNRRLACLPSSLRIRDRGQTPFTGAPTRNPGTGIMPHGGEKAKKMIDASRKSGYNFPQPNG